MSLEDNFMFNISNTINNVDNTTLFNKWYSENKQDVQFLFNSIVYSIESNKICLNIENDVLYTKFCLFVFKNSDITI